MPPAQLAGLAALNRYGLAYISALSCGTPGNCAAGGYTTGTGPQFSAHAFVVSQAHGSWGQAARLPGVTELGSIASGIDFMTCQPATGCSAIGDYQPRTGAQSADDLFTTARR